MFTKWIEANNSFEDARELTYTNFPTKWVWHSNFSNGGEEKMENVLGGFILHILQVVRNIT